MVKPASGAARNGRDGLCCFCDELASKPTDVQAIYPELESRLVLETEAFVAMPSLGQLAPGHLLLVPRLHVTSFGELDSDIRREAQRIYEMLRGVLARRFAPLVCFEHGSPPGSRWGGCGIVHAHIHFVPIGNRAASRPAPVGEGWTASENDWLDDAAALAERGKGYLMWHGAAGPSYLEAVQTVRSQHLRRHAAGLLGLTDWDWRTIGRQPGFLALAANSAAFEPRQAPT